MKTNIFKDGQTIPVKLAENAAPRRPLLLRSCAAILSA